MDEIVALEKRIFGLLIGHFQFWSVYCQQVYLLERICTLSMVWGHLMK